MPFSPHYYRNTEREHCFSREQTTRFKKINDSQRNEVPSRHTGHGSYVLWLMHIKIFALNDYSQEIVIYLPTNAALALIPQSSKSKLPPAIGSPVAFFMRGTHINFKMYLRQLEIRTWHIIRNTIQIWLFSQKWLLKKKKKTSISACF